MPHPIRRRSSRSKATSKPGKRRSASPKKELRIPAPEPAAAAPLPSSYGQDLIVLQARDPRWLCAYWELTPAHVASGRAKLGSEESKAAWILRVYQEGSPRRFDIDLSPGANDWTFQVKPDRTWIVEIGLRALDGRFVPLARSNRVRTPPDRPSDRIDPDWEPIDSLSGGWPSPSSAERPAR